MTDAPPVTHAPAALSAMPTSLSTRAKKGDVPPEERRELRTGFGDRVWSLRVWAGLTQRQLAQRAGLAESTIRELEHGRQRPSDSAYAELSPPRTRTPRDFMATGRRRTVCASCAHPWPG